MHARLKTLITFALGLYLILCCNGVAAPETTKIAVATNFLSTAKELRDEFEGRHPHKAILISGSTGKLYAQIENGAPYDLFLSADSERAKKLETSNWGVLGSRFTYAIGQLVLWAPESKSFNSNSAVELMNSKTISKIAIANPKFAPYGAAASEFLYSLPPNSTTNIGLINAENAGQAYAIVASGNAKIGLLPRSFFIKGDLKNVWAVPSERHSPIRQDAVILERAESNEATLSFVRFLKSEKAKKIIASNGYILD